MSSNIKAIGPDLGMYYRTKGESDLAYIQRIVDTQPSDKLDDSVHSFIRIIVKDKNIFKTAITELSSLKLRSSKTNHNIFNLTLCSTKKLGIIKLLFEELIRRNEFEQKDLPYAALGFMAYKNKLLLETSEPKNAKRAQKIEHLLGLLNYSQMDANNINQTLFQAASSFNSEASRKELVALLKTNGVPQPLTEILLAGIWEGNFDHSDKKLLEAVTPQELRELIFLDRFKEHFAKGGDPIKVENLTIRPKQHALDLFFSRHRDNLKGIQYLIQLIRLRGDAELITFMEEWIEAHMEVKLKLKAMEFEAICKRVSEAERRVYLFDTSKAGQKAFVARHSPETKQDRQILKRLLGEIVQLHTEGKPFAPLLDNPIFSYREKLIVHLKNKSGEFDRFEVYCNSLTQKCEIVRNNLSFSTTALSVFHKELLAAALKGNRLELSSVKTNEKPRDPEYWNTWETDSGSAWQEYTNNIHPAIKHVVGLAVSNLLKSDPKRPVTILEICGGSGKLAKQILDSLPIKPTYVLLEQNQKELGEAKQILNERASVVSTDIVNDAQYYKDESKQIPIEVGSLDVVLGSGALTECVIPSKDSAIACLKKIHSYLRTDGFLILAGHATNWLNSEDFRANGFSVINTSMPITGKDLYILQKI